VPQTLVQKFTLWLTYRSSGLAKIDYRTNDEHSVWLTNLGLLALVVGIQYVATQTLQKALQKAHQELTDRKRINEALLEVVLHTDADGLGVALRNLIENAFKFTRDVPGPMIAICCNATEKQFIILVKDNGIGFDMEYHDRIFEIFHRLQHAEGYSGTGIGLAMARKAVERTGSL
jgi:light-regulated signal transduction histidine kinase (bacteriophytochrome)